VLDEDDRIDAEEDAVIASALREIPNSPSTALPWMTSPFWSRKL
jgi:hypothetical protein